MKRESARRAPGVSSKAAGKSARNKTSGAKADKGRKKAPGAEPPQGASSGSRPKEEGKTGARAKPAKKKAAGKKQDAARAQATPAKKKATGKTSPHTKSVARPGEPARAAGSTGVAKKSAGSRAAGAAKAAAKPAKSRPQGTREVRAAKPTGSPAPAPKKAERRDDTPPPPDKSRQRAAGPKRSKRLAEEASSGAHPIRADLTKAPTREAVPAGLDPEQFRNALRAPIRDSGLPRRIAHGAILPALLSEGRTDQLGAQLDWALEERVPAYYLAESLLQSYLFVGFPRTINALSRLHDVTRSRRRDLGLAADPLHVPSEVASLDRILGGPGDFSAALKGRRIRLAEGPPMHLESPGEGPGSFERQAREWWRRGSELCQAVYGSQYLRLRESLGRIHPELADWMVFEGYGKVLSRPVITPRERELWIIPLLMVQNVPEQLYSHIRGAKNLGVPLGRIRAVIWLASAVAGPKAFAESFRMLEEIERRDGEPSRPRPRPDY